MCELGGGMCALAGLIIAAKCHPQSVTLTDGNPDCIDNILFKKFYSIKYIIIFPIDWLFLTNFIFLHIQTILNSNKELFSDIDVCSMQMIWNKNTVYDIQYNIIVCADW